KLTGKGLDIFQDITRQEERAKSRPKQQTPLEGELLVPDHCLVRFLDVTVKPGFHYEYQIQIRVANPNFGKTSEVSYPSLAEGRELVSPWWPSETDQHPLQVTLSRETHIYGMELDQRVLKAKGYQHLLTDRDVAFMQIHRWPDTTSLDSRQSGGMVPVGDWSI